MKEKCKRCPTYIPDSRKNSEYCSDECAYEEKKERGRKQYHENKIFRDRIKNVESILKMLWLVRDLKKIWTYDDLVKLKFDFTITTNQLAGKDGEFWTVVDKYAYYVHPNTKIVSVWKIHSNQ